MDKQRSRAEEREQQAIDAVKRFRDAVANNPGLKNNPALESLRKTLLKEPLAFFRSLRTSLQTDGDSKPESLQRLADVAHDYAHLTDEIGDKEDSVKGHAESLALWRRLTSEHAQNAEYQAGLAKVQMCQGKILQETGRLVEAKKSYESALSLYQELSETEPTNPVIQRQSALTHLRLGTLIEDLQPVEAMKEFELAATIYENLINSKPADLQVLTDSLDGLAGTYQNMGHLQKNTDKPTEALQSYEKSLAIWRKIAQDFPGNTQTETALGTLYQGIGSLQMKIGKRDDALNSLRSSQAIFRKLTESEPTVTEFQNDLATVYMLIAMLQDPDERKKTEEQAIAIWKKLVEAHPTIGDFRSNLSGVLTNSAGQMHNKANDLRASGQNAEAMELFQKARSTSEEALGFDSSNMTTYDFLTKHYRAIGDLLQESGKPDEAVQAYNRQLDVVKKLVEARPTDPGALLLLMNWHNDLGQFHKKVGQPDKALAAYEECRVISQKYARERPEIPDFACCEAGALCNMAEIDMEAKRFEVAHTRLREAITLQQKALLIEPTHKYCRAYLKEHLVMLIPVARELGHTNEATASQLALQDLEAGVVGKDLDARLSDVLKADPSEDKPQPK